MPSTLFGLSTQDSKVFPPATELATPLGKTFLFFLVWVVFSWLGFVFLISCFYNIIDLLASQAWSLIFWIRPWFLVFIDLAFYTCFSWNTVAYKHLFPQIDPSIREFPVFEMRVHTYVSLHSRVYIILNCFSKSFAQLGLFPGDFYYFLVINCL